MYRALASHAHPSVTSSTRLVGRKFNDPKLAEIANARSDDEDFGAIRGLLFALPVGLGFWILLIWMVL